MSGSGTEGSPEKAPEINSGEYDKDDFVRERLIQGMQQIKQGRGVPRPEWTRNISEDPLCTERGQKVEE